MCQWYKENQKEGRIAIKFLKNHEKREIKFRLNSLPHKFSRKTEWGR